MDLKDGSSLVLPMVYDVQSNLTQLAERREPNNLLQPSATSAASQLLRRYSDYPTHHNGECSIFPAVRELLMNLQLANEPQGPQQIQNQVNYLFSI